MARLDGVLVPKDVNYLILSYVMPAVIPSLLLRLTYVPIVGFFFATRIDKRLAHDVVTMRHYII